MIPKIEFVYSSVYDDLYLFDKETLKFLKNIGAESYPSYKKIEKTINKFSKVWDKKEKIIFKEIQNISGLKWSERKIKCYVVGWAKPFSDPLTIGLYSDMDRFVDVLTHELIHQIQFQSLNYSFESWWRYISKKCPKESDKTIGHIFLLAVHKKLILKIFGKKRLEKEIDFCRNFKDYRRAWEIVEIEGEEEIIKKFKNVAIRK